VISFTETFVVMRFFLELSQHILPKDCQYFRRYGLYVSRTKGKWPDKPHGIRLVAPGWMQELLQAFQASQPSSEKSACAVSDKESRSTGARLITRCMKSTR
jgi:hypothetical protein